MVDYRYNENKKETTAKIEARIKAIPKGESLLFGELTFIALHDGFSRQLVTEITESYRDMNIISIGYRDQKPFQVTKL